MQVVGAILCVVLIILNCSFAKCVKNVREPRWFGYTYTETKIKKEMVTSLVPSSCVHVEATLPPCRSVRSLHLFPDFFGGILHSPSKTEKQEAHMVKTELPTMPRNDTKVMGWAEYFGLAPPTFTFTKLDLKTTTVLDNRVVVTFSVKGCMPSKLPLELDRCPILPTVLHEEIHPTIPPAIITTPSSKVVIQPTPTAPPAIITTTSSKNVNLIDTNPHDAGIKHNKPGFLLPSVIDLVANRLSSIKTEKLNNL